MSDLALFLSEDEPQIERGEGRPSEYPKKAPSSTTVCGRFKNSAGLIVWANREGLAGRDLKAARGDAVDVGHLVHKAIEAHLHGEPAPPIPAEFSERVASALAAWTRWWQMTAVEVVATEIPLYSELHDYNGTLDAVFRDQDGNLAIGDWKTSKGIYPDMLWQVASYGQLWNEHNSEQITGGYHIVKISKEHGDLEYRHFPDLSDALELFLLLRRAYALDKAVAKRAK